MHDSTCDVHIAVTNYLFRIASEGIQSMLPPSPWQGQRPGVRGQAWGCISPSDVLLMLDVKYDAVTHLLYAEMLREHHSEWSATDGSFSLPDVTAREPTRKCGFLVNRSSD